MARPVVHCLQHSERVRALSVAEWARERDVDLRIVRVDLEPLPDPAAVTRLVVLGGQMNTDESAEHPWLDEEREFLTHVLAPGEAHVLGICLGSQLLAEVLGGTEARADVPEVGWQRIELTDAGRDSAVFAGLGDTFDAFEWHGDAWTLPPGARLTATSAGCATQGFSFGDRVHAVQFHPEFTAARTRELAASTTDDLSRGGHVQPADQFLADPERFAALAARCRLLLDAALDVRDGA
jgi:GMP synthase (glutamine-hydrolysing)